MRRLIPMLGFVALVPSLVLAQAPQQKPTPTPEHERLGYFVGKWNAEGEMKQNPWMPTGKYTSSESCEWFEGHFAVVCRSEGKGPMGMMKGLGFLSYSPEEKSYTYYGIDTTGMTMATVPKGTYQNGTWTYTDESMMGGKMVKSRYIMRETSPTSYTYRMETQGEDGTWKSFMEGKSTKVSAGQMRRARTPQER